VKQTVYVKGLAQDSEYALVQRLPDQVLHAVCSNHDDLDLRITPFHLNKAFHTIHPRHLYIHEYNIKGLGTGQLDGFLATGGRNDIVTLVIQYIFSAVQEILVIVNQ